MTSDARHLRVLYFDGRHARPVQGLLRCGEHSVTLHEVQAPHELIAQWPHHGIQWPERMAHGLPVAHLHGGGSIQAVDAAAWHAWRRAEFAAPDSLLTRVQLSWSAVAASLISVVIVLLALWHWGLPWGSQMVLSVTPLTLDAAAGEVALQAVDQKWMRPSELPAAQQEALRQDFDRLIKQALGAQASSAHEPATTAPAYELIFRKSKMGPNAFALPGGTLVMTDELVKLFDGDEAVLMGVLAHELGHVHHRHGMRLLIQSSAIGLIAGLIWGDISGLLATVPVVLGQASYSRDAERQADQYAADMLVRTGHPPSVMIRLFEKLEKARQEAAGANNAWSAIGTAFSSHPADEERIRFFKEADARLNERRSGVIGRP